MNDQLLTTISAQLIQLMLENRLMKVPLRELIAEMPLCLLHMTYVVHLPKNINYFEICLQLHSDIHAMFALSFCAFHHLSLVLGFLSMCPHFSLSALRENTTPSASSHSPSLCVLIVIVLRIRYYCITRYLNDSEPSLGSFRPCILCNMDPETISLAELPQYVVRLTHSQTIQLLTMIWRLLTSNFSSPIPIGLNNRCPNAARTTSGI
jgi:hypothetical protein